MNKDKFVAELKKINISLSENTLNKLDTYKELLKEYNQKFNLTAITDDESIYLKHFYDCLYLSKLEELQNAFSILDIGTGAGFPGMVLALVLPNTKVTLVESNTKKCGFLQIIKEKLNINNVSIINDRAENFSKANREIFDIVTSRAVANLLVLAELEVPSLKVNGYFLPLKSHFEEELLISKVKLEDLGCTLEEIITYNLPIEESNRAILKIKKISKTKEMYPRDYSKIIKDLKKMAK